MQGDLGLVSSLESAAAKSPRRLPWVSRKTRLERGEPNWNF